MPADAELGSRRRSCGAMLSPDNRIGHEEPAGRVNKEGELGVNKRLLAGFPCGFIMFGMISLAEATEIPIHDHFDDAQLDPAWAISFSQVTSWSYTESGTVLSVTDMASTGTGWTSVNLSRHLAAPLSDFNIDFQFSWDSGGDTRSMQNVLVQAYAQDGTKIAEAGYSDGWIGSGGARYGMIGQSLIDTGPDSIASFGSASVTINRIVDVVDIIWDGASLISGLENKLLGRVDMVFSHYVYNESGITSFFGTEAVDFIQLEGQHSTVPEPTTMLLLSMGIAGLVSGKLKKKRM